MRIAVAGGTGLVGGVPVEAVPGEAGHDPVVVARATGVDLITGAGLEAALRGAEAVVDVSNVATRGAARPSDFFTTATGQLLEAGAGPGVGTTSSSRSSGSTGSTGLLRRQARAGTAACWTAPCPATVLRRPSSTSSPGSS